MSATNEWHRIDGLADLGEGRVRTVIVDGRSLCVSRSRGEVGALDNHCPHQGGPLGEGSIENGLLRCPWHGYDYDPITGLPPSGFSDAPTAYEVRENVDGGVEVALPARRTHERTVGDVMVETMVAWGVTHVFGMVGHSNLGFADAMRRAEERGELTFIGIRHEGAAAFAASAYGKVTGRPGVCFAIAGPGSTNLLTGLYDAKVDRSPVVAISGQVPSSVLGRGAFQDLDLPAAFADVSTWSTTVLPASDHAELTTLAFRHATIERAVSHLVLPDEVQVQPAPEASAGGPLGRIFSRAVTPPVASLDAAVNLIGDARRPVFVVGHGARAGKAEVLALAEQLGAPVLTTFKAKGLVSDLHELGGGVLGRSGTPVASWLMNESDALIVFGASFSNHTGIASYKPIVQIDDDPVSLGRFHPVTVGVLGDVGVTASLISSRLATRSVLAVDQRPDVAARWVLWRDEKSRRAVDDRGHGVSSAAVFAALGEVVPADAVMTVDVGNHAYSFGRYFESRGQQVLMSGYLGSIGFGYAAALGAWAAAPDRPIVAVTGDGGFGQYLAEMTTAVKYRIPIRHVLVDNGELGKITKEQRAGSFDVWQTSLHNPDFAAYAELCGARGIAVSAADDVQGALAAAFAHEGPVCVAIRCDADLV